MASTLKDNNKKYTDLKWPPFRSRACIIASASPATLPPIPSGSRQHKTRNPRRSSRGCVRISDIIRAVSHAWIRAGCCTARTRSVPKGEKVKERGGRALHNMSVVDSSSSAGWLEFLLTGERSWISSVSRRWFKGGDGRKGSWDAKKYGNSMKGREGHKSCSLPQVFLVCGKRMTFKLHKKCYDMQRN